VVALLVQLSGVNKVLIFICQTSSILIEILYSRYLPLNEFPVKISTKMVQIFPRLKLLERHFSTLVF